MVKPPVRLKNFMLYSLFPPSIDILPLKYRPGKELLILDQSLLPEKKQFIKIHTPDEMAAAIKNLKVRGANIIGISAGLSLADFALKETDSKTFKQAAHRLKKARPTAVHLAKAVDRLIRQNSPQEKLKEAYRILEEDTQACDKMAKLGEKLIDSGDGIMTFCNTGELATGGSGTALGIIKAAYKTKKNISVYVCETRPVNQGSRLTLWELNERRIPATLLCDNMAGGLMAKGKIQKVITGADRVSANQDVANKTGTLSLAVLAHHFHIPFYIAAPLSAFDNLCKTGQDIPIEQRNTKEVSGFWSQKGVSIHNPAFDITPGALISGIITEDKIL